MEEKKINLKIILTILVVSLGYFVDIYDLILFSVVRIPSLRDLGLSDEEVLNTGIHLLNIQMIGMLLGGVFFGVLADKLGRLSVLFASIILYSLATLLNAYVQDVRTYEILRFVAGFGLAGELGVGVTLLSEILPKEKRGYGVTAIATIGMCGALAVWPVTKYFDWRTAYLIGGIMGFCLLLLRLGVLESGLHKKTVETKVKRGNFFALFSSKERFFKFLGCIVLGLQLWFVMGIMVALSPELTTQIGITQGAIAGEAIFYTYIGVIVGGFLSGSLSQILKSRKKTLLVFMSISSLFILGYFFMRNVPLWFFYSYCLVLGITGGYWAIFVQVAAEQFGTNLRATVTTSVTNFGRATLVPQAMLFSYLKGHWSIFHSGLMVAVLSILISFLPLFYLKETFHSELDYNE